MTIKMTLTSLSQAQQGTLETFIQINEGFSGLVYDDATGKLYGFQTEGNPTWLYGINIKIAGTKEMGALLLTYKLCQVETDLLLALNYFGSLPDNAKMALLDMTFNMGIGALLTFDTFLEYLSKGNYADAAADLATTKWFAEVGSRAKKDQSLVSSCA